MATLIAKVTDYRSFWSEVVVPDYNDFNAAIDNIRRAFHCAISLFHLCDWVYHAHKAYIDANFTYRDRNGSSRPVTDEKTFANALGDLHPDFNLIRGIANSAKHLVLTILGHIQAHRAMQLTHAFKVPDLARAVTAWDLTAERRASCSKVQAGKIGNLPISPDRRSTCGNSYLSNTSGS